MEKVYIQFSFIPLGEKTGTHIVSLKLDLGVCNVFEPSLIYTLKYRDYYYNNIFTGNKGFFPWKKEKSWTIWRIYWDCWTSETSKWKDQHWFMSWLFPQSPNNEEIFSVMKLFYLSTGNVHISCHVRTQLSSSKLKDYIHSTCYPPWSCFC